MVRNLESILEKQISSFQAVLDEFSTEFAENPCHALEWGDNAFMNAARLRIYKPALEALQNGNTNKEKLAEYLRDEILREATFRSRSTSSSSNHIKRELLAAKAELLETVEGRR